LVCKEQSLFDVAVATPRAGSASAIVWKERNLFDPSHRRCRAKPPVPAASKRRPTWRDPHGVMPQSYGASVKVLAPKARPPRLSDFE